MPHFEDDLCIVSKSSVYHFISSPNSSVKCSRLNRASVCSVCEGEHAWRPQWHLEHGAEVAVLVQLRPRVMVPRHIAQPLLPYLELNRLLLHPTPR